MVSTFLELFRSKGVDPQLYDSARKIRRSERVEELKNHLKISIYLIVPIYLFFWLCDWVYAPDKVWSFLALRLCIIPASLVCFWLNKKLTNYLHLQMNVLFFAFANGILITLMIFMTEAGESPYYAGLNMVCIGAYGFVPWTKRFLPWPALSTFLPYYAGCFLFFPYNAHGSEILINSFFISGTIFLSVIIFFFKEDLQFKNAVSKVKLNNEIEQRNKIIEVKTEESVKLQNLSQQFSPQVVRAIQDDQIDIQKDVHRSKICAVFIDIVNSTERVTRIDEDKVDKVISLFMQDCYTTLLKYDITIDKFLGDGILAFCNDPVEHRDYILRVVLASLEIQKKIADRNYLYENYWLGDLEICIGIAQGYANVGFYGDSNYFKSYTAIGPVINLASRLCSVAEPNQILVTYDVLEALNIDNFEFQQVESKPLKGFESDKIKIYSIKQKDSLNNIANLNVHNCPSCESAMYLHTNEAGHFVFKCRECGEEDQAQESAKAA